MNPHPANPANPPAPPAVDISSEAVRQNPHEKVEHVAKAIAKARGCEPTEEQVASCIWAHTAYDNMPCLCMLCAIAAIEALPDPLPDPRLSAQVEAALEALAPFAAYAEAAFPDESCSPHNNALSHHRGRHDWLHVTVLDFRHASEARANLAKGYDPLASKVHDVIAQVGAAREALVLAEPYVSYCYDEESGEEAAEAQHALSVVRAALAKLSDKEPTP